MVIADCPNLQTLQALLGETETDSGEEMLAHLECCKACQDALDTLAGDSAAWQLTATGLAEPTRHESALRDIVRRLKDEELLYADDDDFSFLHPADKPGVLGLLGQYEIQEQIGRGGMGVVLKATDPALNRVVAIKVLAPELAASTTARRRFVREGRAAAAVVHDHIVTVYGVQEDAGVPYLIMQHIEGESLQERLDREGPLDLIEIVEIGMQTASGLAAAHAQGLIHRDIKPANLLLEARGIHLAPYPAPVAARVKITDFGLARMADDVQVTQNGAVLGTPEYMAPEQARGETVDHRADLFSLGSVLYAMCTGNPPFRASSALAMLRQVSDETPTPVRQVNPAIPAWLEAIIFRLMQKHPDARFQQAAGVAGILEGFLAHLRQPDTVAAPALEFVTTPKRRRRTPYLLTGLAVCLSALAFLAFTAIFQDAPLKADDVLTRFEKLGAKIRRDERLPGKPVTSISFGGKQVTDADIQGLGLLTTVRVVSLQGTQVTDAGLKELAPLEKLSELWLGQTAVTDEGVKHLVRFKLLEKLGLEDTKVTDACASDLSGLTKLNYLNLGRTVVTDASMKHLGPLTEMRMLCLYSTGVTDAGLRELKGMSKLQKILLSDTAVTDEGLKHLAGLQQLKSVDVPHTDVTPKGLGELKAAVPTLVVDPPPQKPSHSWLAAVGIIIVVVGGLFVVLVVLRRSSLRSAPKPTPTAANEGDAAQTAISCSACSKKLKVRAKLAGKKVKCPHCGAVTLIPGMA